MLIRCNNGPRSAEVSSRLVLFVCKTLLTEHTFFIIALSHPHDAHCHNVAPLMYVYLLCHIFICSMVVCILTLVPVCLR